MVGGGGRVGERGRVEGGGRVGEGVEWGMGVIA